MPISEIDALQTLLKDSARPTSDERKQISEASVVRLHNLSRDDSDLILLAFPLVFPDTAECQVKSAALLVTYDEWEARLA